MAQFKLRGDAGTDFVLERNGKEIEITLSMLDGFVVQSIAVTLKEAADLACWLAVECIAAARS